MAGDNERTSPDNSQRAWLQQQQQQIQPAVNGAARAALAFELHEYLGPGNFNVCRHAGVALYRLVPKPSTEESSNSCFDPDFVDCRTTRPPRAAATRLASSNARGSMERRYGRHARGLKMRGVLQRVVDVSQLMRPA